jgi:membrane dipeptidase
LVSVNAGYSPHSLQDTLALLRHYRDGDTVQPGLEVAATVEDVIAITRNGGIAVVEQL